MAVTLNMTAKESSAVTKACTELEERGVWPRGVVNDTPAILAQRRAIYIARTSLESSGFHAQNRLVAVVAGRFNIPHAHHNSRLNNYAQVAPQMYQDVKRLHTAMCSSPASAALRPFIEAVDAKMPDANSLDMIAFIAWAIRSQINAPVTLHQNSGPIWRFPLLVIGNKTLTELPLTPHNPDHIVRGWPSPYGIATDRFLDCLDRSVRQE